MELKGNLKTMSLPNILQWIADSKKSGTLKFSYKTEEKKIFIEDGVIVSAASNLIKDRLGALMVKDGLLNDETLTKFIEEGKQRKILLGKLCIEKQIFSEDQAKKLLRIQAERIIESIFHRTEGDFVFKEGELPEQEFVPISIFMHQLFFDSASKRKHWRKIQETLGGMDSVLAPSMNPPALLTSLSELEQTIITYCDENRRILDICASIDRKDFDICLALANLMEKGWLVKECDTDTDEELRDNIWQISILIEQKRFRQAVDLLTVLLSKYPDNEDLKALLEKCKESRSKDLEETFYSDDLKPFIVPGFDIPSNQGHQQHLNPKEWFVFSRINGMTTLKDLYKICGLGRKASQEAIYNLIKIGAVALDKTSDSDSKPKVKKGVKHHTRKPMKQTPSKSKTGEFVIPPEHLAKESDQDNADEEKVLDLKDLDEIYSKYLTQNHYDILGVNAESNLTEVRDAYVALIKKYHPDKHYTGLQTAVQDRLEELFSMVNHAYSVVSNPALRKRYDEQRWAERKYGDKDDSDLNPLIDTQSKPIFELKLKPQHKKTVKKPVSDKKEKTKADKDIHKTKLSQPKKEKKARWDEHFAEGLESLRAKSYKKAVESFEKALKYNAREPKLYYHLAVTLFSMGGTNLKRSSENIKKALILDSENPKFFCLLARIHLAWDAPIEAEKYAKTALAWDAEYQEAKAILEKIKGQSQTGFLKQLKFFKKKRK